MSSPCSDKACSLPRSWCTFLLATTVAGELVAIVEDGTREWVTGEATVEVSRLQVRKRNATARSGNIRSGQRISRILQTKSHLSFCFDKLVARNASKHVYGASSSCSCDSTVGAIIQCCSVHLHFTIHSGTRAPGKTVV